MKMGSITRRGNIATRVANHFMLVLLGHSKSRSIRGEKKNGVEKKKKKVIRLSCLCARNWGGRRTEANLENDDSGLETARS